MHTSLPAIAVLAAALLITGCTTVPSGRTASSVAPSPTFPASARQVNFSDEVSRDLVRQTRQLQALKDLDYQVGPDDVLEISIFEWELRSETRTLQLRVSKSGQIAVPAIGAVQVAGKSVVEIQDVLAKKLSESNLIQNPRVGVTVVQYRSRKISLMGALVAPGVYALQENVALLIDVLSLAGGPSPDSGSVAYVLRKPTNPDDDPIKIQVDLDELFKTGRPELNAVLRDGDVVYVPQAPTVYIYGSVKEPGGISLSTPTTLLEALAVAGGFTSLANKSNVHMQRVLNNGETGKFSLNVINIEKGTAPDPYLQEGDVIKVADSGGKKLIADIWDAVRSILSLSYRLD